MANTTHLELPLLAAAQSQKHVTHNEAVQKLDALVQLSIRDRSLTTPPASPAEGDRYIPASGAVGAWEAWDLNIAWYSDGVWTKIAPREGWTVHVEDEDLILVWDGSEWVGQSSRAGYDPPFTGSLQRSVMARLGDIASVRDFGVKGDGATDDRAAIQAAVDSGVKRLLWPAGTYLIGARIKPVSNQVWIGVPGQTVILNGGETNSHTVMLNQDGLEGSLDDWAAYGITFDGSAKETGFLVYGCQRITFVDCVFQNAGTYGCAFQARPGFIIALPQTDIHFTRCRFIDNGSDVGLWDGLDIKHCERVYLTDCYASGNSDPGFNIRGKDVHFKGCVAEDNLYGFLLQATDTTAGNESYFTMVGCTARSNTNDGLHIQGDDTNDTFVDIRGFHAIANNKGVRIGGLGKTYGQISGVYASGNTSHGLHVDGDVVGRLVVSDSQFSGNGGDGVNTSGTNTTFSNCWFVSNTGAGYIEAGGAGNNHLLPTCVFDSNGTDISTRVGSETSDGFISVRTSESMRLFPGKATGIEAQIDPAGTYAGFLATGNAASVDLALMTKGNGNVSGWTQNGTRQLFDFREAGSSIVNYPDFVASLTGTPVIIQASGTDANIDLRLNPKGTGVVLVTGSQTIQSSDTGVAGPFLIIDHASASPAVGDVTGFLTFRGRDSLGNEETYANIRTIIENPTAGSEDGRLRFITAVAGATGTRMDLLNGLVMAGATGGDQGAGTINAKAVYDDGALLCAPIEEVVTGSFDKPAWEQLAPHGGLAVYEAMKAAGYKPGMADSFADEVFARKGIPGYWNKEEWQARLIRTKADESGRETIDRVSLAEREERLLLAIDLNVLATVDNTKRIQAIEAKLALAGI